MSDGDESWSDPCECVWNHEMAMRRLLSLLRQSQGYCTESECLDESTGILQGIPNVSNGFIMLILCWMALALILFFLRPNSLRSNNDGKPHDNGSGPSGSSPTTPEVD